MRVLYRVAFIRYPLLLAGASQAGIIKVRISGPDGAGLPFANVAVRGTATSPASTTALAPESTRWSSSFISAGDAAPGGRVPDPLAPA